MKNRRYVHIMIITVAVFQLALASDESMVAEDFDKGPEVCEATLGGVAVTLELADDDAERMQGLMYRAAMPENYGMLFVFENEEIRNFWMKDTLMDLDIAFLDKNGVIIDIKRMRQGTETITTSDAPAMYAVEMNAGWFPKNKVETGALLEFVKVPE